MRIVGIVLVQNEDLWVERAVLNCMDFCDQLMVVDNASTDQTWGVLQSLAKRFGNKVVLHKADHPSLSHKLIQPLAGSKTWVFGIDGDEIYDPQGLKRFRSRLEKGEFDGYWSVFGNVLNVESLDLDTKTAQGYLAPPCRSMTKLYNFAAIEAWNGPCLERLHGGHIIFREGFSEKHRCELHQTISWDNADFRCLHLCFLKRSSRESSSQPRKNIMDKYTWSIPKMLLKLKISLTGQKVMNEKQRKYGRGPLVTEAVSPFFPKMRSSSK